MSVLIKDMEMPKNCGECHFCHMENFHQWCCLTEETISAIDAKHFMCPLTQLEPCKDAVSRQAAIDALHTWFRDGFDEDKWWNSTHVLAAIEGLPSAQQGYKWETCFECPLSHGCPKIKGCTNGQAIEYASQMPNDCPLSTQSDHNADISKKVSISCAHENDVVSRKAAIEALARMMPRSYTPDGSHPADEEIFRAQEVFADCIEALEILPSAQPEIIRCKDCEYGEQDEVGRWFCRSLGCQIGNEDGSGFCADAERRNNDL